MLHTLATTNILQTDPTVWEHGWMMKHMKKCNLVLFFSQSKEYLKNDDSNELHWGFIKSWSFYLQYQVNRLILTCSNTIKQTTSMNQRKKLK
jgi:hypothetical protein